jgi:dipeptidyl-peptidase 4
MLEPCVRPLFERFIASICTIMIACAIQVVAPSQDQPLQGDAWQTQAERSHYTATSSYAYVVDLCSRLAEHSSRIHMIEFGKSHEGRSLPLLLIADPPVTNADEVRNANKIVVFAMANIHAGEVCGKEALQMIARDAAGPNRPAYLDQVILLLAPIYNADGNEKMAKDNRQGQNGPQDGMGERENAQGLDLNRDHVKLESPEARALVKLLNDYDPDIVIDCHTTNGSAHRYALTYDGSRHAATPADITRYTRDDFLPEVGRRLEKGSGYRSSHYGNFSPDRQQWETYPAWPRYNTPYIGLRGKIGILSEAYAYAPFQDRVLATKGFVEEIVRLAAEQSAEIKEKLTAAAEDASKAESETAIRTRTSKTENVLHVLGYEASHLSPADEAKGSTHDYQLEYLGLSVPDKSVKLPHAYLFPASMQPLAENLVRHGIEVGVLREDLILPSDVYHVDSVEKAAAEYQRHYNVTLKGSFTSEDHRCPAGSYVVKCNQALNRLIVNLLEPEAEDGYATWNFYDEVAQAGQPLPVVRIPEAHPFLTASYPRTNPESNSRREITFEALYGSKPISLSGSPASIFRWLPDNSHFLTNRSGELWRMEAVTGQCAKHYDRDRIADALAALSGQKAPEIKGALNPFGVTWNAGCSMGLVELDGDLYAFECADSRVSRLTSSPSVEELATFSPDGKQVAFVREFDLYSMDLESLVERRLTTDGHATLRHGKADWVYFEEIYNRDWQGYAWSPDSKWIAYVEYDDSQVRDFFVLNHLTPRGDLERERYPKAGDSIPRVRLGIVSALGGATTWNELADYSLDHRILTRFGWHPDSSRLYVYVQDRAQKWLDICQFDRRGISSAPRQRWESKYWVPDPGAPTYLKDGSFIVSNESSGWRHLQLHRPDGSLHRVLTQGDWEVRSFLGLTPNEEWIYFTATKDSPTAENLYRIQLDGTKLERLTDAGDHTISAPSNLAMFVDTHSEVNRPSQVSLHDAEGELIRTLDTNPVSALEEVSLRPVERFTIKLPSGFEMPCSMIRPEGCEPGMAKKFPVWIMTYGGPHAPTIRDSWQGGRSMEQLLAAMGIIAFRCDPESASGQGARASWPVYQQLGVRETKDLEAAVDWLRSQPYVDGTRIGLSGHSYGGYLTAYAMTHSDRFSAGIAGAPVTDWRNYDAFYTERYMNTPQENPEGYKQSSVLTAAKDLKGKLLLIHGALDDNVHLQNTLQFAEELQRANKDFELMIYPTSRHGIHGMHYQRLMIDFIQRTMLRE